MVIVVLCWLSAVFVVVVDPVFVLVFDCPLIVLVSVVALPVVAAVFAVIFFAPCNRAALVLDSLRGDEL